MAGIVPCAVAAISWDISFPVISKILAAVKGLLPAYESNASKAER